MRVMIAHSRYTTGASSGENRVVADERTLLSRGGHLVSSLEPMPVGGPSLSTAMHTFWSRPAVTAVRRTAHEETPDVAHFHNLFPNLSPAVLRAMSDLGIPSVMTLHNFRLSCLAATMLRDGTTCEVCLGRVPWRGVRYGCYRGSRAASAVLAGSLTMHGAIGSFDRVTLFCAVSSFVRDKLVEGGLDPERVRVRHNFSWPMTRRDGAGSAFLVLGRLSPEKGIDTLLRAWDGRGRLVIAGDGPERERLTALAPDGVEFLGAVEAEAVPGLLADARALLVPSRCYEGSPRAIVEALAAGVPVIASSIGGLPEHVEDGCNGLLVEPDSVEGWTAAIDRMRDDDLSLHLGEGAFRRWKNDFSPEGALRSLEGLYAEAIDRAR